MIQYPFGMEIVVLFWCELYTCPFSRSRAYLTFEVWCQVDNWQVSIPWQLVVMDFTMELWYNNEIVCTLCHIFRTVILHCVAQLDALWYVHSICHMSQTTTNFVDVWLPCFSGFLGLHWFQKDGLRFAWNTECRFTGELFQVSSQKQCDI